MGKEKPLLIRAIREIRGQSPSVSVQTANGPKNNHGFHG
jgi:hypothetical protein